MGLLFPVHKPHIKPQDVAVLVCVCVKMPIHQPATMHLYTNLNYANVGRSVFLKRLTKLWREHVEQCEHTKRERGLLCEWFGYKLFCLFYLFPQSNI